MTYHVTRQGERIHISVLEDEHLLNIIRCHCKNLKEAKDAISTGIEGQVQALLLGEEAVKAFDGQRIRAMRIIQNFSSNIAPYIMEALTRNLNPSALVVYLQEALGRTAAAQIPKGFLPSSEEDESDWDFERE